MKANPTPPTTQEQQLARWLDGEMSAAEAAAFAQQMNADPELQAQADELRELGAALRQSYPVAALPSPDFFNSQILQAVQREQDTARQAKPAPMQPAWQRYLWMRSAVAAFAFFLGLLGFGVHQLRQEAHTEIVSTYVPSQGVKASSFHSDAAAATVLQLDGLLPIPETQEIAAHHIQHSETDAALAATTYYDGSGRAVLVLSQDAAGKPRVFAR